MQEVSLYNIHLYKYKFIQVRENMQEVSFTAVFAAELAANLAAHWWRSFFADG